MFIRRLDSVKTLVYGKGMTRLTEHDWLDHGLQTLARSGFASLKAATLAESLGVSRGSFYWHFKHILDFRTRLLLHWQRQTTDAIIREMDTQANEEERLPELMIRAYAAKPQLERAVRVWATHDEQARTHLSRVDRLRLNYIRKLLKAAGLNDRTATYRARFLYAASLGDSAIAPAAAPPLRTTDLRQLATLLMQHEQ